jgi:hypothetical protein
LQPGKTTSAPVSKNGGLTTVVVSVNGGGEVRFLSSVLRMDMALNTGAFFAFTTIPLVKGAEEEDDDVES